MKKLKILIVDDEKRIRDTIKKVIEYHYPEAEIIGEANNVQTAIVSVNELKPEVVLLDIKMPGESGFDLLRHYKPLPFKVIFVTAFNNFAIQAFKYSAIDYLLKPIIPNELVDALNRARQQINNEDYNSKLSTLLSNFENKHEVKSTIVINSRDKIHVIKNEDIIRCEADGNYTRFYLVDNNPILASKQLKEYDDILSESGFFRVHNSHLVNLKYLVRVDKKEGGYIIMKDGSEIPVSTRKYKDLLNVISKL
ncbi:MAG: hypothetical protein A2W91_12810 [Bacteroidetes bacterium GWF2_38_335]|nr:MAG: hypothetical protein A2W91_12810 [Bacteroidetes bacterium GWF2_38_335]OFY77047.1 MAG: hypothetical protein A2281_00920 [Bacteroidetes bacterium RIFOXYA12_FULL_38_20]HBS86906.1 DNA-binding response regulator [Bacteroidales bacterium]